MVNGDQALIGVVVLEDGQEAVHYFCREEDADKEIGDTAGTEALTLAGAWSDLDWAELNEGLDRIRHASPPSPPISV